MSWTKERGRGDVTPWASSAADVEGEMGMVFAAEAEMAEGDGGAWVGLGGRSKFPPISWGGTKPTESLGEVL